MTRSIPRFADFDKIVFFTGAGMSAESGVPTYRGAGGIWKQYDYQRYATQQAFDRDPEGVWEFHDFRREIVGACEPNAGHRLIAELEATRDHVTVVTQNIDGLHQLAGSRNVVELHGSLWKTRCAKCDRREESRDSPLAERRCACGGMKRPAIVWFGDILSQTDIDDAVREMKACELLVSIGTSAVVYPAAELPLVAKRAGATLVEINPEPTPLSDIYDHCLRGSATEMLAKLARQD
ncbi:MAG: NAD-dependent deacylase [Myxococcales bacterium]|nr:NAD-dependent deacylase [Myxococcales bacterium]